MAIRFRPSDDLRTTTRSLYFFGFLGLIIHIYNVQIKVIPIVSVEVPGLNIAGLFGLLTLYYSFSYIVKYAFEHAEFEEAYSKQSQADLMAEAVTPSHPARASSPSIQAIYNNFQERRLRFGRVIVFLHPFNVLIDLWFPVIFAVYCDYKLFNSAIEFLLASYRQL